MKWMQHPVQARRNRFQNDPVEMLALIVDGQVTTVPENDSFTVRYGDMTIHPKVVVRCAAADDADAALKFARLFDMSLTVMCDGQQMSVITPGDQGMLLDVTTLHDNDIMTHLGIVPKRAFVHSTFEELQSA